MKKYEEKFLSWAREILKEKLPKNQQDIIYADLFSALNDGRESVIESRLSLLTRKMLFVHRQDKTIMTEVFHEIEALRAGMRGEIEEEQAGEDDLIFKMDSLS